MMTPIPFYSCAASLDQQRVLIDAAVDELFTDGAFVNGTLVRRLEEQLRLFTGARHAIACGNATDALAIMLKAAGIGPGDEVAVPSFSFFASASAVVHVGARPVFVDIDPDTYAMDPAKLASVITPATKAIMPVHLFSQMADMPSLIKIADRHGLRVLEDSAEGIGMRLGGRHAGLLGDAGVLSFFPTKTLGAFGDAGMVLTNDDQLAEVALTLRNHGQKDNMPHVYHQLGFNSRMDSIQAAVLLAGLAHVQENIARRAQLAEQYSRQLSALAPVVATPRFPARAYPTDPVYYVYLIECDRRDELALYLGERGIATEIYYPRPLHLQPCFAHLGYQHGDMPRAERACKRTLGLPLYPDLTAKQVAMVCAVIAHFYEREGSR